ncbi:Gmh1 protein [Saccharomycopsis crataegensis]|uniref:Gmh1 protein n=1 Tax=Saccharomycopsis crataegensis TaxID=43959 RepID=A0AAV5QTW4_9ASCO|nr:Gmh1 protein [Saccharomycopsis crataegensis]
MAAKSVSGNNGSQNLSTFNNDPSIKNNRNSVDSLVYSNFSPSNIPRHQGPGSIASSSYSNFRKQNFTGGANNGGIYGQSKHPYGGSFSTTGSNSGGFGSYSRNILAESAKRTTRFFKFKVPVFFKRVLKPPTLDFDKSIWEIFYLIFSPKKVYKSLYYHKYTKNYYHRDDPSFIILISFFLVISAIAWGITYNMKFLGILKLILYMVVVDFYVVGIIVATINWFLVNKFLRKNNYMSELYGSGGSSFNINNNNKVLGFLQYLMFKAGNFFNSNKPDSSASLSSEETLEWAYCFDIHANSFLIIWINLYLVQFILLPVLVLNNFLSRFLGNTLYLITLSYYSINSFYGYNILPFLLKTEFILIPIPIFMICWLVMTLGGFNMTNYMVDSYFN